MSICTIIIQVFTSFEHLILTFRYKVAVTLHSYSGFVPVQCCSHLSLSLSPVSQTLQPAVRKQCTNQVDVPSLYLLTDSHHITTQGIGIQQQSTPSHEKQLVFTGKLPLPVASAGLMMLSIVEAAALPGPFGILLTVLKSEWSLFQVSGCPKADRTSCGDAASRATGDRGWSSDVRQVTMSSSSLLLACTKHLGRWKRARYRADNVHCNV